ncbi:MAG: hypothetical protein M1829_005504 [Trizodia sp. TS-e1964]|nr:MAG: hypothetical protein M1829_005504 [Trizodia sp. TS-e1964]
MRFSTLLFFAASALVVAAIPLCPESVGKAAVECRAREPDSTLDYPIGLRAFSISEGPDSISFPLGIRFIEAFPDLLLGSPSTWKLEGGYLRLLPQAHIPLYLGPSPVRTPPSVSLPSPFSGAYPRMEVAESVGALGISLSATLDLNEPVFAATAENANIAIEILNLSDDHGSHWDAL